MIIFMGKKYIGEKEAAIRYGYSAVWFRLRRYAKRGPAYMRLDGRGKIYYELEETDQWFKDHMTRHE